MEDNIKIPLATKISLWLFPLSVLIFLFVATVVSTYDSETSYFVSIFSIFFMAINAFVCFISSFLLCKKYSCFQEGNSKVAISYFKALILNVFGGYHFMKKLQYIASDKKINIETPIRIGILEIFYLFFLIISIVVSLMMSKGVGTS